MAMRLIKLSETTKIDVTRLCDNYFHKTTTSQPDVPYYHIIKLMIEGLASCPKESY